MINQRIFSANVGDSSVGIAGPDAIEQDIDNLLANDQELEEQINSLDAEMIDYESGTFTPFLYGVDVAGEHGYAGSSNGRYVRINNYVYILISLRLSNLDSNMNGNAKIGGLPYPYIGYPTFALGRMDYFKLLTEEILPTFVGTGAGDINIIMLKNNSVASYATKDNFTNNTWLYISGEYIIS